MQISIDHGRLKKIMKRMSGISPGRYMPILSSTKIDGARFTATDLEIDIVIEDPKATVAEEGVVCLDTALLRKVVEKEKGPEISIQGEDDHATLRGSGTTKIYGYDPEEFPEFDADSDEDCQEITIEPEKLAHVIKNVINTTSDGSDVPVLTGAFMHEKEGNLAMVATNSFNLAICEARPDSILLDGPCIVPEKFLRILLAELPGVKHYHVTLEIRETSVKAILPDGYIRTKLISGEFPNYKAVLPEKEDTSIVCSIKRKELLRRIDMMSLFSDIVEMTVDNQMIALKSKSQEGMTEQSMIVGMVEDTQESFETALNAKYLRQFLTNATGEEITMGLTEPLKPIMLWSGDDEGYQHLIMPIKRSVEE